MYILYLAKATILVQLHDYLIGRTWVEGGGLFIAYNGKGASPVMI